MAAEDIVKKFADSMNGHDIEAIAALWAQDAVIHDPMTPEPVRGKDAIKENLNNWLTAFPDLTFQPFNILSSGDTIGFEVALAGTNRGPLQTPQGTVDATNKRMEFTGVGFWKVNAQGLIVEERRYYDSATIPRQLGLLG